MESLLHLPFQELSRGNRINHSWEEASAGHTGVSRENLIRTPPPPYFFEVEGQKATLVGEEGLLPITTVTPQSGNVCFVDNTGPQSSTWKELSSNASPTH